MNKKVIIIGGFHEIIELCEELNYSIVGIIDNNPNKQHLSYPIIGNDNDAYFLFESYKNIPLVVTPDSPAVREKLFKYYTKIGFSFESVISTKAKISKSSSIGSGTIIQDGVNVSANTKIGNFVKLNTGSNVMHDCMIGDFVTIAPNAVILGEININQNSYIGANATILPGKRIAENVIIGAGAVLTKDITENNAIYAGVPAKKIN